jgi:phospholipid-translocating ATPase
LNKAPVKRRREQHLIIKDIILALSLCHNVTPTYPDEARPDHKELQASSPDEVALVKFSDSLGIDLRSREELYIKLKNTEGNEEEYDILGNFPFSSETKRMGIIVRHRESNKIIFYLKGAETVMMPKVRPNQRDSLRESCENLAMDGLRTLVISQKLITERQYLEFNEELLKAKAQLFNREQHV